MKINDQLKMGNVTLSNRVVIQPMEGCDCEYDDGRPSDLTLKKYVNNAHSGASIIWFEANAVSPEGRTNHRQMMITEKNVDAFRDMLKVVRETAKKEFGYAPICIIQLTHSGRQSIVPMIAYRHPLYEKTRPVTDENIVTDEYLDTLPDLYLKAAKLAKEAGFDGVDVKSCHGYLFQEMLSAFSRPGRYGGSFENRTRLFINSIKKVRENMPNDFIVASRISITDMIQKPYGFGTTENNEIDLTEPKKLLAMLENIGIKLINITLGNPYYNPHVNRPFKKGAYTPNETAETGLKRFHDVGLELKKSFPNMTFVNSGLSYYREDLIKRAEELLNDNAADLVGFGRMSLAYPTFYADYLKGQFDPKKCCLACSNCTVLMRHKQVAGCAIFNPYYRNLLREKVLCQKK